jgi:thiamine pyrophosphokinase
MGTEPPASEGPIILLAVGGSPVAPSRLTADHLVGDLDSADPELVAMAEAGGTVVHRHLADKDATDLELALDLIRCEVAPATGLDRLLVVGSGGGRLDHLLADLLALASPLTAGLRVAARLGPATATVVRPSQPALLHGAVGDLLSLLPMHGPVAGVTTTGVRWPLLDADLVAGTTRALSNELLEPVATVGLRAGVLVALQPGEPAAAVEPRPTPYDPTPRAPGGSS